MASKFYALLTHRGAAKLAQFAALGTKLNITQMAVGDGGGSLPTPDPMQTQLRGEKRRAGLNLLTIDPLNTNQIIAEQVIPERDGGFWIREIGLFDEEDELIAVANCAETYKPLLQEGSGRTQTIRLILIVSSTAAVTLKIDPSVILATRQYVDDAVIEVRAYVDEVMEKHQAAQNPHSQYLQIASALVEIKHAGLVAEALQNLGLKALGTSGEKIPLLNRANTWSAQQIFSNGITGALTGNATTATKLQTARNINGMRFDGSADVNISTLVSRNRVNALSGTAQGTAGIQMYEAYNNGYPTVYGNVLHLKGAQAGGEGELLIGWSGTSGAHAPVYIRSRRDSNDAVWSGWAQVYTSVSKPSAADIGAYTKAECNSRFITGIRLGTRASVQTWKGPGWADKAGYVVTASINGNRDEFIDSTQARPLQYCINGTWYTAGSI